MFSDDYLQYKTPFNSKVHSNEEGSHEAVRFFMMTKRVPLELQMLICKKIYNSKSKFYSGRRVENALKNQFGIFEKIKFGV